MENENSSQGGTDDIEDRSEFRLWFGAHNRSVRFLKFLAAISGVLDPYK
jgi:hypothetical protein